MDKVPISTSVALIILEPDAEKIVRGLTGPNTCTISNLIPIVATFARSILKDFIAERIVSHTAVTLKMELRVAFQALALFERFASGVSDSRWSNDAVEV